MTSSIKLSLIIGAAAIISAFFMGGRFSGVSLPRGDGAGAVVIFDRFTGSAVLCQGSCRPLEYEQ